MTHAHAWGRWLKGRRTGIWLRHCGYCGETERSEAQPEEQPRAPSKPVAAIPEIGRSKWCPSCNENWDRVKCVCGHTEADDFNAEVRDIRDRMAKFDKFGVAKAVRRNIVDWRAKQAGE
jgi:hypothetical protein